MFQADVFGHLQVLAGPRNKASEYRQESEGLADVYFSQIYPDTQYFLQCNLFRPMPTSFLAQNIVSSNVHPVLVQVDQTLGEIG